MKTLQLLFAALFLGFLAIRTSATTYYVDVNSTNSTRPYLSWSTASTDIQSAVNQTTNGDLVLVNPGVYQTGGETVNGYNLTNRVAITQSVTVQSVNGSAVTLIQGYQVPGTTNGTSAVRCVYMTTNAALIGFTLANGATRASGNLNDERGGGIWCASTNGIIISNCIITANSAFNEGGGVYQGVLNNCTIANNSSGSGGGAAFSSIFNSMVMSNSANGFEITGYGGGTYSCTVASSTFEGNSSSYLGGGANGGTLSNCTIIDNSAPYGGGVCSCNLTNCLLAWNTASIAGGGANSGTLINCVVATNSTTVYSSSIYYGGGGAYNCFVQDCTIIGNNSASSGGGLLEDNSCNCTVEGNSAAVNGGGCFGGYSTNCLIIYNFASGSAGAFSGTRINCTIVSNTCPAAGNAGADVGTLQNCIVRYNYATNNPGTEANYYAYSYSFVNSCCTVPLPSGAGHFSNNITNDPSFVNLANGDFHLQSNSPCINSGNNAYFFDTTDLDGNPRIVGGTVDIGAYEYQTPVSMVSYEWLEQYGLSIANDVDTSSPNGTAFDVYQDWIAGLNPTNPASVLVLLPPVQTNKASGITVTWQSVSGINYNLQRADQSLQSPFVTIQTNITGQTGTTSYLDTSATNNVPYFYRVGVP